MSDHKRAGLHRAFSPSGLSGSNIHLAWCIPGLETLMWFVGKSRWQVHGSTLLTDSAGASGRVHNNTKCLSPPPFPRLSNHTSYLNLCINMYIFSFSDITLATGQLQQERFGMLSTMCLTVSCFPVSSFTVYVPFSLPPTDLYCLTSLHSLLLATHMHIPFDSSPSSFGSHSLHQSLSSFPFLHLVCSPLHSRTEQTLKNWKCGVLSFYSCAEWCHAQKVNPSAFVSALQNEREN